MAGKLNDNLHWLLERIAGRECRVVLERGFREDTFLHPYFLNNRVFSLPRDQFADHFYSILGTVR